MYHTFDRSFDVAERQFFTDTQSSVKWQSVLGTLYITTVDVLVDVCSYAFGEKFIKKSQSPCWEWALAL